MPSEAVYNSVDTAGFDRHMRVVVTGATGNVGTSVIEALGRDVRISSIIGIARRGPALHFPKTTWIAADVTTHDLVPIFRGADAVVHLAWLIQPSRDIAMMRWTNVHGSERVFHAAVQGGVPALVYASSVGAYSPGPKDSRVDESWPTHGIATSTYSRHKSEVERILDGFESDVRIVRLRKALVFKREAATEIRRLFLGPLFPASLLHPKLIRVIPRISRLRFQAVHSKDVGEAYRLAVVGDLHGAFNIAAEPILDPGLLAHMFGAWQVPVPAGMVRSLVSMLWRLRLQPSDAGWLDLALESPLLDTTRARRELGWSPRYSSESALLELLDGMRRGVGVSTSPLSPSTSGPFRVREFRTGVGGNDSLARLSSPRDTVPQRNPHHRIAGTMDAKSSVDSLIQDAMYGSFGGAAATVPMTALMVIFHGRLPKEEPTALPPRRIARLLNRAGVRNGVPVKSEKLAALLAHLAFGALAGALWGAVVGRRRTAPYAKGVSYGLFIWAASYLGWLPALDLLPSATKQRPGRNALMIGAHVIWGAALAALTSEARLGHTLTKLPTPRTKVERKA